MNCAKVKESLARWFDEGCAPDSLTDAHLKTCPACRAYAGELKALECALVELPAEAPPLELAGQVQQYVRARGKSSPLQPYAATIAVCFLAIATAVAGWFFPLEVNWRGMGDFWLEGMSQLQGMYGRTAAVLVDLRKEGAFTIGSHWPQGQYLLWALAAGAALTLVAFNALEALLLRRRETGNQRWTRRP